MDFVVLKSMRWLQNLLSSSSQSELCLVWVWPITLENYRFSLKRRYLKIDSDLLIDDFTEFKDTESTFIGSYNLLCHKIATLDMMSRIIEHFLKLCRIIPVLMMPNLFPLFSA